MFHNHIISPIAMALKTNEASNKSGSRNNLNFAMLDSINAMAKQNAKIFSKKTKIEKTITPKLKEFAIPQGKNKLDPSAIKIISLLAAAHSISASFLPEYSKIIAS